MEGQPGLPSEDLRQSILFSHDDEITRREVSQAQKVATM